MVFWERAWDLWNVHEGVADLGEAWEAVEICAEAHPDSTTDDERWDCVDIRALAPAATPVTLDQIKAHPDLEEMVLVKNSRLSVQPVTEQEWGIICGLAGISL